MLRWCDTEWGGEPIEHPEAVASFGGDAFVEVDLHVVPDREQEDECPKR